MNKKPHYKRKSTPLTEQQTLFVTIINEIWNKYEAPNFHYPVDYKTLGLIDYPIIIKNPMDLNTIYKNILANKYHSSVDFSNDIQLIWNNCRLYNQE